MTTHTVTLVYEKSTKGTHVFVEPEVEGKDRVFPTIYVQKTACPGVTPKSITVTVQVNKDDVPSA